MNRVAAQAYLNTRVSTLIERLLTTQQIEQLAQAPLPALAEQFGLQGLLDERMGIAERRRALEQALIQRLLADLVLLIRSMSPDERALMLDWARKYALFNLKALIRGKLQALDRQAINTNLFELPDIIRLADDALFGSENVLELLRRLESGPYRQIARQAREVYEQRREPFALEAAIDQRYLIDLVEHIQSFAGAHQVWLRRLISAELDRIALLWLLRFRLTYRFSPSETYYWLVPSSRVLTRSRLLYLVNLDGLDAILDALPDPLHRLTAGSRSIAEVEQRLSKRTVGEIQIVLARSPSAVARALAYLMRRELDLRCLFAVLQGRLLGFPDLTIGEALGQIEPAILGY
ncbi:V-type ATPase subunit [Caldichromatium japonicum]|uniref:V-type ATPase subunit n=1 Tax=Caldichromatium japonicum TaxID=2699430 RepID=A0A6G7VDS2_9GAMM|nr:V-type ATPase subunit [Caldichromatium japonicum]QIK38035.1 V-type ATPase subunit [Caldichromatium japonicum]